MAKYPDDYGTNKLPGLPGPDGKRHRYNRHGIRIVSAAIIGLTSCRAVPPIQQVEPAPEPTAEPLTQADYEAITNGMALESVQHILGQDGQEISRAGNDYTFMFESEDITIMVTFLDGRVFAKSVGTEKD